MSAMIHPVSEPLAHHPADPLWSEAAARKDAVLAAPNPLIHLCAEAIVIVGGGI